ncbi:MAG: phosphoethanolamine--lipid A transferase [Bdellovibrionales bacterium]|nr:phosphoethanolamine--lipid A transferase [Massilia sp.]
MNTSPRVSPAVLTLAASVFLVAAYNNSFWRSFANAAGPSSGLALIAGSFALIALLFNTVLSLLNIRYVIKPVLVGLFLATALASYFMNQYGVQIDRSMIQNALETDTREAQELLNWRLLLTLLVLGVLPSLAVWRVRVDYAPGRRRLAWWAGSALLSLVLALLLLVVFFKSLAPTLREHRELRYLLTPTNYIQAIHGHFKQRKARSLVVKPLGVDAVRGIGWGDKVHRSVTLVIVGETARAANFSLNGYARITNPELSRQPGLLNFTRMTSCGTATAVSLPCVFSVLGRENYSDTEAYAQQGLLDVLQHAGFNVLWRDNNSGCKGACDRVAFEDLSQPEPGNKWCVGDECYDERLLDKLPDMIRNAKEDLVVVLHQKGSHGPAYYKRYPAAFKRFGPVCETNQLEQCSRESIIAGYDNTILYTDHFLNQAIELLKEAGTRESVNTAMMYFSDHGESLGEHNIYLHGAPYMLAPAEQKQVPFMIWMSDGFAGRFHIDQRCLAARTAQEFSHDNVFHSVLGMLRVNTAVYNPRLDVFAPCTREN